MLTVKPLVDYWKRWTPSVDDADFGDGQFGFRQEPVVLPYCGDLESAKIVALFLNPGWDESTDDWVRTHLDRLFASLYQEDKTLWLAKGPSKYWTTKWAPVVKRYGDVLDRCAFVNLVPFFSPHFKETKSSYDSEPVRLTLDYARELASDRSRLVLVCRKSKVWSLSGPNVVNFVGVKCRGVHFHAHVETMNEYLL